MALAVELVRAWPGHHESAVVSLEGNATVADALRAAGWAVGGAALAVFGERVQPQTPLRDGDRIEILRPLAADPKLARRERARQRSIDRRGRR